ncbi:hypothetical protein [Bacillus sp. 1P06AnD]|uniref:hypothetical protein n=1 Tax=Bacillus sp. 1P06AnD TaxID=3132208 RepID=UPI0039A26AA9
MNTKGFILLDTLGALSVTLLVCLFLLSSAITLQRERQNGELQLKANHYLYEKLEANVDANGQPDVRKRDARLTFAIQASKGNPLYKEGCVRYKDNKGRKQEICDLFAKEPSGFHVD